MPTCRNRNPTFIRRKWERWAAIQPVAGWSISDGRGCDDGLEYPKIKKNENKNPYDGTMGSWPMPDHPPSLTAALFWVEGTKILILLFIPVLIFYFLFINYLLMYLPFYFFNHLPIYLFIHPNFFHPSMHSFMYSFTHMNLHLFITLYWSLGGCAARRQSGIGFRNSPSRTCAVRTCVGKARARPGRRVRRRRPGFRTLPPSVRLRKV